MGHVRDETGKPLPPMGKKSVVLTSWLAESLQAQVGDAISAEFLAIERGRTAWPMVSDLAVTATSFHDHASRPFNRRRPPEYTERPTTANDADLTPLVKGITDQNSISNWKAPFDVNYKYVRAEDDTYWENHRTTPKMYVSKEYAKEAWGSRFGVITSLRVPVSAEHILTPEQVEQDFLAAWRG